MNPLFIKTISSHLTKRCKEKKIRFKEKKKNKTNEIKKEIVKNSIDSR